MKEIKKILIANRGEIACRIIATCKELKIETVGIYTEKEKGLPHMLLCSDSYSLGEGALLETYLNQELIIDLAKKSGADAIHPGYGFLSENANFANAVEKAGLIFIGPAGDVMILMGDKKASKIKMEEIKIPLIPGYHGMNQDADFLLEQAEIIKFPVLIKASAGGGGKGMRVVSKKEEFKDSLDAAKREAQNAFGNDDVLIEKYITSPRHIEVQVMSDQHGQHFHLFERECSIQRRHQKIIEETPSTALTAKMRNDITQTAVKIAQEVKYVGAGTIEFILDEDGLFYFLEMNTRLQVEHPITEMVTGLDLVRLQIEVAAGKKIDFKQSDITQTGHAIEVRLYAEDPDNNFLPSIGKIKEIAISTSRHARFDCGYKACDEVTVNFDPMLAKLIIWSETRDSCIAQMAQSLSETSFLGLKTNGDYLLRVLNHPKFIEGETYTHFVETYKDDLKETAFTDDEKALALGVFLMNSTSKNISKDGDKQLEKSIWSDLNGFRNS